MLNLANVLHKSGELSDAALVTDMALQASTNMVTVHFAMANILAAKVIIFFSFSKNKKHVRYTCICDPFARDHLHCTFFRRAEIPKIKQAPNFLLLLNNIVFACNNINIVLEKLTFGWFINYFFSTIIKHKEVVKNYFRKILSILLKV